MAFFQSAVGTLQTLVIALGAGLGIWGAINLMEGYGNDNPGAKSLGLSYITKWTIYMKVAYRKEFWEQDRIWNIYLPLTHQYKIGCWINNAISQK